MVSIVLPVVTSACAQTGRTSRPGPASAVDTVYVSDTVRIETEAAAAAPKFGLADGVSTSPFDAVGEAPSFLVETGDKPALIEIHRTRKEPSTGTAVADLVARGKRDGLDAGLVDMHVAGAFDQRPGAVVSGRSRANRKENRANEDQRDSHELIFIVHRTSPFL